MAYSTENIIVAELTKGKTSKFTFNTEKFEDYMNYRLGNEVNSKDKILEFRKRLLDRNKNFIKTREDIEYNGIKSTNTLEYIEEQMCPFVPNDSRIEETLEYPLYEFVFSDENKVYSFFIPIFTRITTDKNSKELSDTIKADAPNDVKFLASLDNDQAYVNEFQNADFYSYVVVPKKQKLGKYKIYATYARVKKVEKNAIKPAVKFIIEQAEGLTK